LVIILNKEKATTEISIGVKLSQFYNNINNLFIFTVKYWKFLDRLASITSKAETCFVDFHNFRAKTLDIKISED